MKRVAVVMAVMIALACAGGQAAGAGIPQMITYQGLLTDSLGNPLNGTYTLDVGIYKAPTGTSASYAESFNAQVTKGVFSVMLGTGTKLNPPNTNFNALPFNEQYYLGISVDHGTELTPRVKLASVGSALNADRLDGQSAADFAQKTHTHTYQPPSFSRFTASGTFAVPAGVTAVYISGQGGGGGGIPYVDAESGSRYVCPPASNGATLDGLTPTKVTVAPGTTYTVTVGAGGTGYKYQFGGGQAATAGTPSKFSTTAATPVTLLTIAGGAAFTCTFPGYYTTGTTNGNNGNPGNVSIFW